jgi:hypothetical protein
MLRNLYLSIIVGGAVLALTPLASADNSINIDMSIPSDSASRSEMGASCKDLKKQCDGETEGPGGVTSRGKWCYYKTETLERCRCCFGDCLGFKKNCDDIEPSVASSRAETRKSTAWEQK